MVKLIVLLTILGLGSAYYFGYLDVNDSPNDIMEKSKSIVNDKVESINDSMKDIVDEQINNIKK